MGKDAQGINGASGRFRVIPRVLVFLRNESCVLLLKGAPEKRLWANLFNGVGGHVEAHENVLSGAKREVLEETGINVSDLELSAVVNILAGNPHLGILMFVFVGWTSQWETSNSAEGELHWISIDDLDTLALVEDLRWLLPRVLSSDRRDAPLYLHYSYSADDRLVIQQGP